MFLLIAIGCLECGNESEVLGIFKTKEEAEACALKKCGVKDDFYAVQNCELQLRIFDISKHIKEFNLGART